MLEVLAFFKYLSIDSNPITGNRNDIRKEPKSIINKIKSFVFLLIIFG